MQICIPFLIAFFQGHIHFTVALVGLGLFVIYLSIFMTYYIDFNPNSNLPFAAPQSTISIFRGILKLVLAIYNIRKFK